MEARGIMTDFDYYYPDGTGVTHEEMEDRYQEFLDEIYPTVDIGYTTFYPGQIVREMDPTAFGVGVADYVSNLIEDEQLFENPPEDNNEDGI